jgi:hypothetical protein
VRKRQQGCQADSLCDGGFDSYEIDTFQSYGKADVAQSFVFAGLSVDVKELFSEVSAY